MNLNNDKAKKIINWKPNLDIKKSINLTIGWYKYYLLNKGRLIEYKSSKQIQEFEKLI